MDSIGDMLRRARNDRGFTLDDVAARTRISRKHLEAIERDDRSAIPGGFFYKSFVRQYAAALATPDSDLVDDIEELLAGEQPTSTPVPERPVVKRLPAMEIEEHVTPSRAPSSVSTYALLLVLALAGSTGFYIWWHRAQQAQAAGETRHAEAAAERTKTAAPTAEAPAIPSTPNPAATNTSAQASAQTNSGGGAAAATQNIPPAPTPQGRVVVEVTASDVTWFSVTADGKSVFSGIVQPGETKAFGAQENVRMKIGNAGGLDVKYNGRTTGALGPKGQVRTVVFSPSSFEILKPQVEDEG